MNNDLSLLMKGLNRLAKALDNRAMRKMLNELKDEGVEYAKSHVMNIDTGDTRDSISGDVKDNVLTIEAGENASWLEFGTGITYNPDGYIGDLPEGISPIGTFGQGNGGTGEGWYFPTSNLESHARNQGGLEFYITDDGTRPLAYQLDNGTWMVHTFGIPSNHFMWDTGTELEEKMIEKGINIIDAGLKAW